MVGYSDALENVDHTAATKRDEVVRFLKEINRANRAPVHKAGYS